MLENKTKLNLSVNMFKILSLKVHFKKTTTMFKNIYGGYIENNIYELKACILEADFREHLYSSIRTHVHTHVICN